MTNLILSVKPKYARAILSGEKTIELRKTIPKADLPYCCYIYETSEKRTGRQKIVGAFKCEKVVVVDCDSYGPFDCETKEYIEKELNVTRTEFITYGRFRKCFGWYISNVEEFPEPISISDFTGGKVIQAPESWRYIPEH